MILLRTLLLFSALIAWTLQSVAGAPVTVSTTSGNLRGGRDGNVDAYLGIPYAKPPVGALRWRAPVKMDKWTGTRDASGFAASCYQPWPPLHFGPYTPEFTDAPPPSEDCLYLNVWTPRAPGTRLPVLVWIHGGAFLTGSGAIEIYNGRHLASQGVVVVTINYRVGPFGFLALPELTAESSHGGSGNYGLLDMIAALQWVRENISAFGGSPEEVTIAGQSAGAAAVNDLLASPAARGLFKRAVAESGSGMGFPALALKDAQADALAFAKYLGATTLAELRALPPERLQEAVWIPIAGSGNEYTRPRVLFRPVLDHAVLAADPEDPAAPVQSNVPLITGYNADEGYDPGRTTSVADFERLVRERYGVHAG
ncbi:MAG TPA: carboxylesterase family protein, partial [Steroidobacteraceae bacterium]